MFIEFSLVKTGKTPTVTPIFININAIASFVVTEDKVAIKLLGKVDVVNVTASPRALELLALNVYK